MARELNIPRVHGEAGYTTLERLWARPTFEVNGIFGGYQGQRSKTIIPASATVKITCRLVGNQDPARVHKVVVDHIRNVCPDTVRLEINDFGASPPVLFDVNNPTIRAAQEALRKGFGRDTTFIRCGGSIPVVSTFAEHLGCPVILMGFGLDSDGPHSPNEHFSLDSFVKGVKSAAYLLRMI
jgi:acetylornithine deacetylase/succinyl-diaminopimelate desuccinylase-like protein